MNLVHLVDGVKKPYSQETLEAMYSHLDQHGELFGLKSRRRENGFQLGMLHYLRIISHCDWEFRLPTSRTLEKKILSALIELARVKGWKELRVKEIYTYNHVSRRCFKSLGFVENGATEKGMSFVLKLI